MAMKAIALGMAVLIVLLAGAVVYGMINPPATKLALPAELLVKKLALPAENLAYAGAAGAMFVVEGQREGRRVLFLINPENPAAFLEITGQP
jgi:hypothetical protein